jgi:hypothetical protein
MKENTKNILLTFCPVWLCSIIALGLIVAGFFVPPIGIIDGSVIQAVGEIIGIIAILELPQCIEKFDNITFKHRNTEINLKDEDGDENNSVNIE